MAPMNSNSKKRKATSTPSSSDNIEDGVDRMSSLPNSILGCILTLLSITEAVRMTRVSKTWRRVFSSPEYKLDYINDSEVWCGQRHLPMNIKLRHTKWRSDAITSLLDAHHHSIRRFIVQRTLTPVDVVSRWLYTLSQSGVVEELVLEMPLPYSIGLSHSIFKCSSLRSLSLSNCRWPQNDVTAIYSSEWTLPCVKELTLHDMDMTTEAVKDLLARCPALQSLSLGYPRHYQVLDIKCKNLLSLTKVDCGWQYEIHIVDAPKLERLLWWPLTPKLTSEKDMIAKTPRLHTLGILHRCPFEDGVMLEHVRTIALFTDVDNLMDLMQAILTLRHLPQLETLHLKMMDGSKGDSSRNKPISFEELIGSPILCLENSVKTIVLRVNNLVRQKLAFTNFLLGAAKSLKFMVIYRKRMVGELLTQDRWGSSSAQVVFGDNSNCTLQFDTSASNYKLADPFMA